MESLSKWKISNEGRVIREGNKSNSRLRIFHLDDHRIFREAIKDYCIRPFYPFAKIIEIENGDIALEKVKKDIASGNAPDLIITDINHRGLMGHEFIKKVREFEELQKREARIPFLIISMVAAKSIINLSGSNNFGADIIILSKGDEGYQIAEAIDTLLHQ